MRRAMGYVAAFGVCLLLAGFVAIDIAFGAMFGVLLGHSEESALAFGLLGGLAVAIKAIAAIGMALALRTNRYGSALACALIALVTVAYSFSAAFGYAGYTRAVVKDRSETSSTAYSDARKAITRYESELEGIPKARPSGEIEADLTRYPRVPSRWVDVNAVAKLTGELARAKKKESLEAKIAKERDAISALGLKAVSETAQAPQAGQFKRVFNITDATTSQRVDVAFVLLIPFLLEIVTALGILGFWPMIAALTSTPAARTPEPPPADRMPQPASVAVPTVIANDPQPLQRDGRNPILRSLDQTAMAAVRDFLEAHISRVPDSFESTAELTAEIIARTGVEVDARQVGAILSGLGFTAGRARGVRGFNGIALQGQRVSNFGSRRAAA